MFFFYSTADIILARVQQILAGFQPGALSLSLGQKSFRSAEIILDLGVFFLLDCRYYLGSRWPVFIRASLDYTRSEIL